MSKIDYNKIREITVVNQEELDNIPAEYTGRVYIAFGTYFNRAVVRSRKNVVARGNSSVEARENSSVVARENSSVVAWGNSSVVAWGNSSVEAWENSSVVAWGNSSVEAWGNSSVEAWGNSSVVAWGNSSVEAWENSSVVARENSSVVAWGNSSVEANANVQVVEYSSFAKISVGGNARIVHMPKTIHEFMDFYGIVHDKTTAKFFKAVHKSVNGYFSDYNSSFAYTIGGSVSEKCDKDTSETCSYGIHISHRDWALKFGESWDNMAILEMEVKIKDVVIPDQTDGKVRTSNATVLREVPLEECGLYGKMIAKRRANK